MTPRKNILQIINDNSLELYHLITSKKMKIKNLYEALITRNKDLILEKKVSISKKSLISLKSSYTKEECFDEILYLTNKRYKHLLEIRKIVNIDKIIEEVITDKIYKEKIKIHYTDLIIDLLIENFYDYDNLKKFCELREKLIKMDSDINHEIIKNIDKYYIKKITI